ncbi:MAG: TolB-like 6-bladed beta-propeller domain-containing protein [Clostridium sp.]|nr:TolB-like 6-bladed beta-propeller domain-containing protein [Bacteroides sp.]MCM1199096.1 TolB-like 6-bladed beta-propeller domain-containing protein [Clostridium sp.]
MGRIFACSFLILFMACSNEKNSQFVPFDINDFEQISLRIADAERIECENLFLAKPMSIVYHPDNFIIVRDKGADRQLTIIDLTLNTASNIIERGRATNELVSPWDISVSDRDIYVSSLNDNKLIRLQLDSADRTFGYSETFNFNESFFRCIPYRNKFLTLAPANSGHRFHLWNTESEIIDTLGNFPPVCDKLDNGLLQSVLTSSPDGRYLAAAYIGADYIDVYENLELKARLRGPEKFDVHATSCLVPDITAYTCIAGTEKGFYAGYVGMKIGKKMELSPDDFKVKIILHFSWDGSPIKAYLLDIPVDSFAVDEKSGYIYFLTSDPEYEIKVLRMIHKLPVDCLR